MVEMFGIPLGTMMVYVCFNFTPHTLCLKRSNEYYKASSMQIKTKRLVYLTVVMQIQHFKSISHISEGKS